MKCICPSGGNRTCPDDCLHAKWWSLPPERQTKAARKPIAEQYYKQGYTMEAIATQLGVTQQTITNDLRGLQMDCKPPRPKGGRPKGSKKKTKRQAEAEPRHEKIVALADAGMKTEEIADAVGVVPRQVNMVVQREQIRREAEAQIDPATLSQTAQEKLAAAMRQHQRKLDLAFQARIEEEIRARMEDTILPRYRKEQATAKLIIERRRGIMDKNTFNKIRRCLHPDSRQSVSDKVLAQAFDEFMALEKCLLNEKDSPTMFTDLPSTYEGWMAMRRPQRKARGNGAIARR